MDFNLTDDQKSLVALARDFGKREITPEFMNDVLNQPSAERMSYITEQGLLDKIHDTGLMTLTVPEKYGGGGADLLTQVFVEEALGRYGVPIGHLIESNWKMCADLAAVGTEEQQEEFYAKITNDPTYFMGEVTNEADHGCDPVLPYNEPGSGLKTFAYRDGDEYVINGEKCFTCGAGNDDIWVYLRTDKNKPLSQSMSCLIVPTSTPGYSVQRINEFLHDAIRPNGDPLFENVRVPARYLIGKENRAYPIFEGRRAFWLILCAVQVGAAQTLYELTKEYAKTRIQGGRPISDHLTIGTRIVDMYSRIEDVRWKIYKTAWEYDQMVKAGNPLVSSLGFNLCNAAAHDLQIIVAEHAAEVWGGRAALKGLPVEGYIRGAWGSAHGFGTATFNRIKCMSMLDGNPYLQV